VLLSNGKVEGWSPGPVPSQSHMRGSVDAYNSPAMGTLAGVGMGPNPALGHLCGDTSPVLDASTPHLNDTLDTHYMIR
jgi:hypothetical protein